MHRAGGWSEEHRKIYHDLPDQSLQVLQREGKKSKWGDRYRGKRPPKKNVTGFQPRRGEPRNPRSQGTVDSPKTGAQKSPHLSKKQPTSGYI